MKNVMIRFRNMKAVRVGRGIRQLRQQSSLSLEQLADKCEIDERYLNRLEEGYELEVESKTLEGILQATGVCKRGSSTPDELVNIFLHYSAFREETPTLI